MMSVKYIDREKTLFPIYLCSKHEVSKCMAACPVLDGTLRTRRGGANVMKSRK